MTSGPDASMCDPDHTGRSALGRNNALDSGVHSRGHTGDMSNCCAPPTAATSPAIVCPISGTRGKLVELLTVKALLTEKALRRVSTSNHRFCPEPTCEVVYFDETGHTYSRSEIRVPVWQKQPFGDGIICYCFGENEADIRTEMESTGNSEAVERVRAHIEAGRCACEVRNPRGA